MVLSPHKKTEKGIAKKGRPGKRLLNDRAGLQLFLFSLPFLAAVIAFSYLPLFGWVYSFFDYHAGLKLSQCKFVGLKYFLSLVNNSVTFGEIVRVMKNTFAMSFLGILVSPLAIVFAILLGEVRHKAPQKVIQTLTTLPNFISWILVYSVAYSMFSVEDGFVNRLLISLHVINSGINFLASDNNVWLTMLGYSTWKTLGWTAIIYLAVIVSIDQEQYEAAIVDGAGRFQKIWHITIPGLMPTFFVLLLLNIANFINNGMAQYYVFQNAMNKSSIEVLDLYVYNQGMVGVNISFATAVGMLKSFVSVILLFTVNKLSYYVRGEKIM